MKNSFVAATLAALVISGSTTAFAQAQPGTTPTNPGFGARPERPGGRERPAPRAEAQNEGLTEEQRQKVRAATEKAREEQRLLSEKLRDARRELEVAAQAEEIDEVNIRAKAAIVGQIEGDLAIVRAKQYKELRNILPKEQVDRLQRTGPGAARFGPGAGGTPGGRPPVPPPAQAPGANPQP